MKVHEHQAKEILRGYGVVTPRVSSASMLMKCPVP